MLDLKRIEAKVDRTLDLLERLVEVLEKLEPDLRRIAYKG